MHDLQDFFARFAYPLAEFSQMSRAVGKRADYVQGGGGNTSVKLGDDLMAIKASGYHLNDVMPASGYAVLQGRALRDFYMSGQPAEYPDVEKAGAERARELTLQVPGLIALRPSVEAGFHSLLKRFVIHSHSIYANLAACSERIQAVTEEALGEAPYGHVLVPYVDPGAMLTFTIRDALSNAKKEWKGKPSVLLMQNHGLIVHADTAQECLSLHEDVNRRFMRWFDLGTGTFPIPQVVPDGTGFVSDTPWLAERLIGDAHPDSVLLDEPLYPDQMVFFQGSLGVKAHIDRQTGKVRYHDMTQRAALTLEETLCAVVFIRETLLRKDHHPVSMGEAARAFISGWESEKYRKSLTEKE